MSWTYGANPVGSPSDAVRLLAGDTDPSDQQLQDEEIAYFLQNGQNGYQAAAMACDAIAAKYSRKADTMVGRLRLQASTKSKQLMATASRLRYLAYTEGVTPFAGGETISGKATEDLNTDRIRPAFTTELMAYPGTEPALPEFAIAEET